MKFILPKYLVLVSLTLVLLSCNGQVKNEKQSPTIQKVSELNKIAVPEYGFSSGLLDNKGNLWFASNGGGVFFFDGKTFKNYTEKNGLSSNQVFSIIEDKENNLWFGTQNGLTKYDRKTFTHIPIPFRDTTSLFLDKVYPVINPNAVHSLTQDKKGDIWVGTAGGGAYSYKSEKFNSHLSEIGTKQEDSLYHNWIPDITEDSEGNIWFASMTHGGVSRYDGEVFKQFLIKDGLSDDMVRIIYNDKSGKIWFGFNGNRNSGLTVFDGNSFKTYSIEDGLCNKRIRAIYEDKNGNLWLGAGLGNLCVFDGQKFSEFNYNEQTFSDVFFILGDLEDNIWFGGRNGIWKYDGETVINMTR